MHEPEDGDRGNTAVNSDLVTLLHEHQRLRSDVEQLLAQKQQLLQQQESASGKQDDKKKEDGKDEKGGQEKKEEPKPPLKQRVQTWTKAHPNATLLIIVGVVVLAVAIFFFMRYLSSYETTDDAQIDGHTNQISSRVSGTVIGVYVEDDRTVNQGQVLVDLDSRDYLNALAQARANFAQAVAGLSAQSPNVPITQTAEATNVATAQLSIATADSALQAARQTHQSALAELEQAKANSDNATLEEVRYRHLADKEEVSRELYDQKATQARAQAALVAAKQAAADAAAKAVTQREAELAQVRDRFREAQTNQPRQVAVQHAQEEGRRASVEAARAQVQQAELNLTYCKIVAPVNGIVGSKTVEVGQQVAPGEELFAITPTDDIWVTANFKETQLIHMHSGLAVNLHVDALDLDFDGYVQNMPGATGAKYSLLPPENATGNYVKVVQRLPVRIRLKAGQPGFDRLRPGMSVEPKVWLK